MEIKKMVLEHGDKFGKLTVLKKVKTKSGRTLYRVGCECGYSGTLLRATQLIKGHITACLKCSGK